VLARAPVLGDILGAEAAPTASHVALQEVDSRNLRGGKGINSTRGRDDLAEWEESAHGSASWCGAVTHPDGQATERAARPSDSSCSSALQRPTAGRIENCQIGVFLGYASRAGRAFLDRKLYLPQVWIDDVERRREVGVPETVVFATKPQVARTMLERARAAAVSAAWVAGDEVYGNDAGLRGWLDDENQPYVLAVSANHLLWQEGKRVRADDLVVTLPGDAWTILSAGPWHEETTGSGGTATVQCTYRGHSKTVQASFSVSG